MSQGLVASAPLHPQTLVQLKRHHPWVIKDRFTEKFPPKARFIKGLDQRNQPVGIFLHDPWHPKVKARLWSRSSEFDASKFWPMAQERLDQALSRRKNSWWYEERDNCYLVFAENDDLPGLRVLKLGDHLFIRAQSFFWQAYRPQLEKYFRKNRPSYLVGRAKPRAGKKSGQLAFRSSRALGDFRMGHSLSPLLKTHSRYGTLYRHGPFALSPG